MSFQGLSHLTQALRYIAQALPTDSRLRQCGSAAWDNALGRIGCRHLSVPFAGQTVRLAIRFRHWDPAYEAAAVQSWLKLVTTGDVAWDLGANIGLFTLITAQKVGTTGRVVAWEPSPRTFRVLTEHIHANGLASICEARNSAAADVDGCLPFDESPQEANTVNRLAHTAKGEAIQVPVERLDSYLRASLRPPAAIKIDIEGAEVLALRGARGLLCHGAARPVLMVAVHPQFLPEFNCGADELITIAAQHHYVWTDLDGRSARPTEYAEYLMIPNERLDQVRTRINSA